MRLRSPRQATDLGIEVVYQDLALAPHLDPVQNVFLGREITAQGRSGQARLHGQEGDAPPGRPRLRRARGDGAIDESPRSGRCPAASARASPSPGPSPGPTRSSSSTSRPPRWASCRPRTCWRSIKRVRDKGIAVVLHHPLDAARARGRRPDPGAAPRPAGRDLPGPTDPRRRTRRRHDRRPGREGARHEHHGQPAGRRRGSGRRSGRSTSAAQAAVQTAVGVDPLRAARHHALFFSLIAGDQIPCPGQTSRSSPRTSPSGPCSVSG